MQLTAAYQAIPLGTRSHLESLASDIRFVTRELDRKNLKWFFFLLAARAAGKTVATKVTAFKHIAGYAIKAGAKAVGFANSMLLAWGADGAHGVETLIKQITAELRRTMSATGCANLAAVNRAIIGYTQPMP